MRWIVPFPSCSTIWKWFDENKTMQKWETIHRIPFQTTKVTRENVYMLPPSGWTVDG